MKEPSQEILDKMNYGRMLRLSTPTLLPLLAKRKENTLGKLIATFKSGHAELLPLIVAELAVYSDLESEINRTIKETEHIEGAVYGNERK